ncbi:hypothetical protein [Egicoccus halophilus]|uniref:Asparagine synthetase domain-containing protein n=1 Tax=Egicoccus halophilus TaxID=1670830 RepID=A0A8J3ET71_9ACTN|nr:hypothetical protein [Egicoccus halophilus]GGI05027.1 hypothetical protein GCM10011354_12030 [Egicoccus halophilus]
MSTDFAALDARSPLPPDELPRQWVLRRDGGPLPEGWQHRMHHGWHLAAHPDAHVCELTGVDGNRLGWLLEPQVRLGGERDGVVGESLVLDLTAACGPEEIERALYGRDRRGHTDGDGVEGTWVAVVVAGAGPNALRRVYVGAMHSIVFSAEARVVATTANLVPDLRRDEALSHAFDPLATNASYTFGLTAHRGVRRLLPNHYLDLDDFEARRHWPVAALPPLDDGRAAAMAVVEHGRRLVRALATAHREYRVFLSAGRDSRAVLALLRPFVAEGVVDVRLSTTTSDDLGRRTDLQAARRLARMTGLAHDVDRRQAHDASDVEVQRMFLRIGEAKAGPVLSTPALVAGEQRDTGRFKLAGMAGETARGFYWGPPDRHGVRTPPPRVDADLLLERTESPRTPTTLTAADAWLQGLPAGLRDRPADVLDLAYVEQRLGCWEAPSRYLWPGRPLVSSPMAACRNLELMLRLPIDHRARGRLQHDMVAFAWPELLRVPFNRPTGWLALPGRARRLARAPRAVRRRVSERREARR